MKDPITEAAEIIADNAGNLAISHDSPSEGYVAETIREAFSKRTCDACIHWIFPNPSTNVAECKHPKMKSDWAGEKSLPVDAAWPAGIGSEECLFTGPKFGCIHWEAKE
jgi:hypothetical protein